MKDPGVLGAVDDGSVVCCSSRGAGVGERTGRGESEVFTSGHVGLRWSVDATRLAVSEAAREG